MYTQITHVHTLRVDMWSGAFLHVPGRESQRKGYWFSSCCMKWAQYFYDTTAIYTVYTYMYEHTDRQTTQTNEVCTYLVSGRVWRGGHGTQGTSRGRSSLLCAPL